MGMYDSVCDSVNPLLCPGCSNPLTDFQTKAFDCTLACYEPGNKLPKGTPNGAHEIYTICAEDNREAGCGAFVMAEAFVQEGVLIALCSPRVDFDDYRDAHHRWLEQQNENHQLRDKLQAYERKLITTASGEAEGTPLGLLAGKDIPQEEISAVGSFQVGHYTRYDPQTEHWVSYTDWYLLTPVGNHRLFDLRARLVLLVGNKPPEERHKLPRHTPDAKLVADVLGALQALGQDHEPRK